MKSNYQFSKKKIFTFIFVCIFISSWTFFLGIIVGRQTVTPDIEPELNLSQEKSDYYEKMQKKFEDMDLTSLGFYEKLKENSRFVPQTQNANKNKKDKNIQKKRNSTQQIKKARKASESPKDELVAKRFRIQAGSFTNRKTAELLLRRFREKGLTGFVKSAQANNKEVWRIIIVGFLDDKANAHRILNEIMGN
ncbi:MAG TPA: SPOR domain-containing protein [Desulfobacterales bacterium]|nr:SPOR domain-containing protein [Desulfobacterales bacterium]